MGWIGDTNGGRVCWFVTVVPPELILLTASIGLLPLIVTLVLYGIILYHALQKIVQLKKAAARYSGAQTGQLRVFVGGGRRTVPVAATASSDEEGQNAMAAAAAAAMRCQQCGGDQCSKKSTNGRRFWCCCRYVTEMVYIN